MSESSLSKFSDLFDRMTRLQVISINASVKRIVLGSNIRTNIMTARQAHFGNREDGGRDLVLALKFEAHGFDGDSEVFTGECQVMGVWPVRSTKPEIDLDTVDVSEAMSLLYIAARQHISDTLGKVGLQTTQWPWYIDATGKPAAEEQVGTKTVRKKRVRLKK
jgi:hypothetical protein